MINTKTIVVKKTVEVVKPVLVRQIGVTGIVIIGCVLVGSLIVRGVSGAISLFASNGSNSKSSSEQPRSSSSQSTKRKTSNEQSSKKEKQSSGSQGAPGGQPPRRNNKDDQSNDHEDSDTNSDQCSEDKPEDSERTKRAKKALRKYVHRVKNGIVSGGSYTQVYTETFSPTAGVLETNHVIPISAYEDTPYAEIGSGDMPVIIMQRPDHRGILSTIRKWYRQELQKFMKNRNFCGALHIELYCMWKAKLIKEYYYDIVLMLRYCRDEIIAGTPGGRSLITNEEYKKLRKLLRDMIKGEPESTSSEYENHFGDFFKE